MLKTIALTGRIFQGIFNLSNASCSDSTLISNLLIPKNKIYWWNVRDLCSYLVHETMVADGNCQSLLVIMIPCSWLEVEKGPSWKHEYLCFAWQLYTLRSGVLVSISVLKAFWFWVYQLSWDWELIRTRLWVFEAQGLI